MSLESVFSTLRKWLSSPGQNSWLEIQRALAFRQDKEDYPLVRDFVLEHLRDWGPEQLCSYPEMGEENAQFPQDPLFYLQAFQLGLPEDSFQAQALKEAQRRLQADEIRLVQVWRPAPIHTELFVQAEERFGMDIPEDIKAFYKISDGFGLAFLEKNNTEHYTTVLEEVIRFNRNSWNRYQKHHPEHFYLGQHEPDWYHPSYRVFLSFVSFADVFLPTGRMEEHDQHIEEDDFIHTRVFSYEGTDSHAFCFPVKDQLETGRTGYDKAWILGYGNDHWIAYDESHYIHFSQCLKNRLYEELRLGEPGFHNAISYIAGEEAFRSIPAVAFDFFPISKEESFEGDSNVVDDWIRQFEQ